MGIVDRIGGAIGGTVASATTFLDTVTFDDPTTDIKVPAGDDLDIQLGSNDGTNFCNFNDSDGTTVLSIDSDGELFVGDDVPMKFGNTAASPDATISWATAAYDRLSVVTGGDFVVTLGDDAGVERLAAADSSGNIVASFDSTGDLSCDTATIDTSKAAALPLVVYHNNGDAIVADLNAYYTGSGGDTSQLIYALADQTIRDPISGVYNSIGIRSDYSSVVISSRAGTTNTYCLYLEPCTDANAGANYSMYIDGSISDVWVDSTGEVNIDINGNAQGIVIDRSSATYTGSDALLNIAHHDTITAASGGNTILSSIKVQADQAVTQAADASDLTIYGIGVDVADRTMVAGTGTVQNIAARFKAGTAFDTNLAIRTDGGGSLFNVNDGEGLLIEAGDTSYTTADSMLKLLRSGNITGVGTEYITECIIAPLFTLTDPPSGNFRYMLYAADSSNVAITAGAANTDIVNFQSTANIDTDANKSYHLYCQADGTEVFSISKWGGINSADLNEDGSGVMHNNFYKTWANVNTGNGSTLRAAAGSGGMTTAGNSLTAVTTEVETHASDAAGSFMACYTANLTDNGGSAASAAFVDVSGGTFDYTLASIDSKLSLSTINTGATFYDVAISVPTITTGAANQRCLDVSAVLNDSNAGTDNFTLIRGVLTPTDVTSWDSGDEITLLDVYRSDVDTGFAVNFDGGIENYIEDDSAGGPYFDFFKETSSPAASDSVGEINFWSVDSNADDACYALIEGEIGLPTQGSETGKLYLGVLDSNSSDQETPTPYITLDGTSSVEGIVANVSLSYGAAGSLTIAAGAVAITKSYHSIVVQGGTGAGADDLATATGGSEGGILVLKAATSGANDTVTVKNGTGANTFICAGGADFIMDHVDDRIQFIHNGTEWVEMYRSDNS